MWGLDRLSNQTSNHSSLPLSRPYSPAPQRSNLGPARPAFNPRDSSLSLVSPNASHTSLPAAARIINVKRQNASTKPPDVEDPVAVLQRVVGEKIDLEATEASQDESPQRPGSLDPDVAFQGLSLQDFVSREIATANSAPIEAGYSQRSVEEYARERERFDDLHKSISACDEVLRSVEKYLSSFQADLSAVSAEIETLQTKSTGLNTKLENRKNVEKLLGPLVDRVTLPPHIVKKISEGTVDESWVRSLEELQQWSKSLESTSDLQHTKSIQDSKPLLENLSNKAVERIRDYFASQIRALRSPNVNAQLIQQRAFLRFRSLYAFLAYKQPQLAEEITQAYVNTMRWYYHTHFTRYQSALSGLRLYTTDKNDVLGVDPLVANKGRTTSTAPKTDVFGIARRLDILRSPATTALPSHAAEESKASHHIETPYLALNLALIDNASFEYTFMTTFFSNRPLSANGAPPLPISSSSHAALNKHFQTIFQPVINVASTATKSLIVESNDALGVLLMIRITQHLAFTLQRRKVPALESYINGTNMLLWPRFQSILDANCTSLRQLTSSLPNRPSGSSSAAGTLATLSGGPPSGGASTAPHPVTQRFANLVKGIIDLSSEAGDDEPVSNSLSRLRNDFEAFLVKLGTSFGSGEKARREKSRLLSNNYSLILAVLGDAKGRLADETRAKFEELKKDAN